VDRLLLLMTTTTYKAEAFLAAARTLAVEVVVGSDRPQALASLHPQGHLALPFADLETAVRQVLTFAASTPLTAIVAADDEGVVLAAHLAQSLGLAHNSVDAVRTARDKLSTRRALQAAGLLVPGFRAVPRDSDPERLAARVDYPCVVKPLALSGSRGVIRANGAAEFVAAFSRLAAILSGPDLRDAEHTQQILVEDYIPGLEMALEGLLQDGELRTLALFDKPDPLEGPFFQETIYVTPSRQPRALQSEVVDTVRAAARALGLRTGPLHAEVRCNAAGTTLLEAAPRSIGGLCARALRFGAGEVSLEELVLRQALGRDTAALEREPRAAGVMMIPIPRAGILRRVGGVEAAREVEHVEDVRLTVASGQPVLPPPEGGRYLGFLFARAATPEAVEAALRRSHARLVLEIEDAAAPPHGSTATPSRREGR